MPEKKRPLSVTIVTGYLIASALFTTIGLAMITSQPEIRRAVFHVAGGVTVSVSAITILVDFIAAVAIFRRVEWGRQLWGWWAGAMILYDYVVLPSHWTRLLSLIVYATIMFFLFRRAASEWFEGAQSDAELLNIFG